MAKAAAEAMQIGIIDIQLTTPIKINGGVSVGALRMREPTVGDDLAYQELEKKKSAGEAEVVLIANLCEVTPEEIKTLTIRDYKKAQKAYSGFLG